MLLTSENEKINQPIDFRQKMYIHQLTSVYKMLKIANSNMKKLAGVHKIYKSWTPKIGADVAGLPLHDGAKRFFKEAGAL